MRWFSVSIMNTKANAKKAPMGCFFCLGKRDPNPYWFNIEIFAVIASNTLKIRQVFSAVFSLYRQKSLMLNCSHLTLRCFSQDFSAAGCRQADACQIRQTERLQKHPSSGNACSSLACLGGPSSSADSADSSVARHCSLSSRRDSRAEKQYTVLFF